MCCLGECTGGGSYTRWHQLNSSKTQLLLLLLLTSNLLSCRCPRRDLNRQHAQAASPPHKWTKEPEKRERRAELHPANNRIVVVKSFHVLVDGLMAEIDNSHFVIGYYFRLQLDPAASTWRRPCYFYVFFRHYNNCPCFILLREKEKGFDYRARDIAPPSGYISFTHDVVQSAYRFVRLPPVCPSHLRVEIDSLVFFQFISATPSKTNKLIRWIYKNCICLPLVWFVSWCRVLSAIGDLLSPSLCVMRSPPTHISLFD